METEIKFGVEEDSLFQLLNPNVCEYQAPGEPFTLEETNETGKAVIRIVSAYPCFVIRCLDEKAHIRTLPFFNPGRERVRKCADHLAFLFDGDNREWTLHIFELKRSPNERIWQRICAQFNGAMVRAYAVAGALRISEFAGVYLHCGYRKDMSSLSNVMQIDEEGSQREPSPESVLNRKITLVSYPKLVTENQPIKLDDFTGQAEIQLRKNGCTIL